jgi:predicted AAA+ superfamily ATPase
MAVHARLYDDVLREHFERHRQMALVSGPRQVGKTTTCRALASHYLNWDNADDRRIILRGPAAVADSIALDQLRSGTTTLVLDELHKNARWKAFLKGFFDVYAERVRILVTGSSRLDVFRRGADSLMGRYFPYRMHPYSVAECIRTSVPQEIIQPPSPIADEQWNALWEHGGFPQPFLRREIRFTRRWRSLRHDQLTKEDVRQVAQIQDLGTLETLSRLLEELSSRQLVYSRLANELGVSVQTVQRWVRVFECLYYGFTLRPWFTNLNKALRKEPKWFLRDWSGIEDTGARAETFVACHLLKAVEAWSDLGFGRFELFYLRDKLKREVDFLIVRDRKPWCLVEVKATRTAISDSLRYFHAATKARYAFQLVIDLPYIEASCFARSEPTVVPARTLLSQLL